VSFRRLAWPLARLCRTCAVGGSRGFTLRERADRAWDVFVWDAIPIESKLPNLVEDPLRGGEVEDRDRPAPAERAQASKSERSDYAEPL